MATHPFLSDEWIEAARELREQFRGRTGQLTTSIRMNQIVTDVPFGTGTIDEHLDTSGGEVELDLGHLDHPDVTITTDYATAKALFVEQDQQAAMQAFMGGRIRVQGDMSKLLGMAQSTTPDEGAIELAGQIKAITEA